MVQKERRFKKEIIKRIVFSKKEFDRTLLKSISRNKNTIGVNNIYAAYLKQHDLRIKSRSICFLTGRFRGIYKFARLSRHMIDKLNRQTKLQSVKKKSW